MADTIDALEARLEHEPDDLDAYIRLKRLLQADQDHARVATLVESRADRTVDDHEAARLYHEAARIVSYYLREDDRTVGLLARSLDRDPRHEDSAEDLERMLEVTGDGRRHAAVLERRAKRLADIGAKKPEIATVHHRIGELYEHDLGRSDKALSHYRSAYELDPDHVAALYAAREIHRLSGNLTAAATLLEMEATAEPDRDRRKALLLELAHLASEALRDEDRAVKALGEAVAEDPRDVETLHAYALALHRRASTRPGSEASTRDLVEMADVLVKIGSFVDEPTAMSFLESALDAAPTHEAALEALERLCERFGANDRLAVRWVAYLSSGGAGPKQATRRHALADAYLAADRPEDAIICLEPLLETGDASAPARLVELYRKVGRTAGLPKAMRLSVSKPDIPLSEAQRVETLRELLRVAREARDAQETRRIAEELLDLDPNDQPAFDVLVLTLASKADHASLHALHRKLGVDERLRIERRLEAWRAAASVAKERLHDNDSAIDAWRAIAALAPDDIGARRALRERLRAADRHGELAEELAYAADAGIEDRAVMLHELLDLAVQPEVPPTLLDRAAMLGVSRGVRDLAVFDRAIDAAERSQRFEDALTWLDERAEGTEVDSEKASFLLRAARIADTKLGDAARALALLERRAAVQPLDLALTNDAIRIARAADAKPRVLAYLIARTTLVGSEETVAALREAARYADEEAADLDAALSLHRDVLSRVPSDHESEDAVRGILARVDRQAELVSFLTERAALDAERAPLLLREAVRVAETASLPPETRIHALEALLTHGHDDAALEALLDLLRAHGPASSLAKYLASALAHAEGEEERTAHAMERITVLADVLGDDAAALEGLEALREMAPTFAPALGKTATIHERRGDHEALTRALRAQLDVARGPSQRLETARRILAIHDTARPDDEAALEALRAWRLAAPDDASAVERMVPLLERTGAYADALEALDALLALAPEDPDRDERRRRAAMIAVDHLGDAEGAIARLLAGALDGDTLAEPELRRVAEAHGKSRALAKSLEAIGRAVDAPPEAQRRLLEAAEIYEHQANDLQLALESTIGAYELGLSATHLLPRIADLAARASGYERLYVFHVRRSEDAGAPGEQIDALLDALSVAAAHLDPMQAKRALMRALDVAGEQPAALAKVEQAAAENDAKRSGLGLVRAILNEIDTRMATATDDAKRALVQRGARLLLHAANRPRDAFERLLEATEEDPDPELHALLVEAAVAAGAGRVLDDALAQRVDEALDSNVAKTAMRARASLFERESRHSDAADLYQRLSGMSPNDDALRDAHRNALARAGRNTDLVSVLDASFRRAKTPEEKLAIARERAKLWETALANRYEALDAWKKVIALAPDDVEATVALRRLSPKTRVGADELADAPELEGLPPRPSRLPPPRASAPPTSSDAVSTSGSYEQSVETALPAREPVAEPTSIEVSTTVDVGAQPRDEAPVAALEARDSNAPPPTTTDAPEAQAPASGEQSLTEHVEVDEGPRSVDERLASDEPSDDPASLDQALPEPSSASHSIAETVSVMQALQAPRVPSIDLEASMLDTPSLLDEPIEDDFDRPVSRTAPLSTLSQEVVDALDQELTDDHDDYVEDASDFVEDIEEEQLDDSELIPDDDDTLPEPPSSSSVRISLPPPPPPRRR